MGAKGENRLRAEILTVDADRGAPFRRNLVRINRGDDRRRCCLNRAGEPRNGSSPCPERRFVHAGIQGRGRTDHARFAHELLVGECYTPDTHGKPGVEIRTDESHLPAAGRSNQGWLNTQDLNGGSVHSPHQSQTYTETSSPRHDTPPTTRHPFIVGDGTRQQKRILHINLETDRTSRCALSTRRGCAFFRSFSTMGACRRAFRPRVRWSLWHEEASW